MKHKTGFLGILMLIAFSAAMWVLIRAGGGWEFTARILIFLLGGALGLNGVKKVIDASNAGGIHKCYLCGTVATRYCDFQMHNNTDCGRYACSIHMSLSRDGKRDFCDGHDDRVTNLF